MDDAGDDLEGLCRALYDIVCASHSGGSCLTLPHCYEVEYLTMLLLRRYDGGLTELRRLCI